jgi:hypothetical protein
MSKPLSLLGKFILIAIVLSIVVVFLYALELPTGVSILFFFLFPILIIILGKSAELIIRALEKVSTGPLSLIEPKNSVLLFGYYVLLSIFLAVLIENSAILSLLNFRPNELQVALISLGLAFLPRVLSYASGTERARNTLLAILTPLTLTAAFTLFTQPVTLAFRQQTLELCIVGGLIQIVVGDLALYSAGFLGIIHPIITIETISMLDLQRVVYSQLETIQWDRICQIFKEAKQFNRDDISQKICRAMNFFVKESREREAKLARITFVDALVETIYSSPDLRDELIPYLEDLDKDPVAEVRARTAYGYAVISRKMPDKSLQCLSRLVDDKDINVLLEVGRALTNVLNVNSNAVSQIIKLSLNPVFLNHIRIEAATPRHIRSYVQVVEESDSGEEYVRTVPVRQLERFGENPILKSLKIAYVNSPKAVLKHFKACSSDKDPRLRVLVAAVISDSDFTQHDKKLLRIKEKLKKDKSRDVRKALTFSSLPNILRRRYHPRR